MSPFLRPSFVIASVSRPASAFLHAVSVNSFNVLTSRPSLFPISALRSAAVYVGLISTLDLPAFEMILITIESAIKFCKVNQIN